MTFTFLHAADLHLGSPLSGLAQRNPDLARTLASAGRDAFCELVTQALAEKVAFVLLAGDIYDGDWKDTGIGLFFNRQIARLTRAGIRVLLVRGNHDAESEITRAVPLPGDDVTVFASRKNETVRLDAFGVAVHGRSFADRAVSDNIAVTFPAPVAGMLNIGLLHTSCEGNAQHATYAPCSVADLVARGYDYWALGHIHEHAVLRRDPWIVYPGNIQGRSIRECGPRGAVLVDVADGRIAGLRRLVTDKARFAHIEPDISACTNQADVLALLREAVSLVLADLGPRLAVIRVTLRGHTVLDADLRSRPAPWREDIQAALSHVNEDAWLEKLHLKTFPPLSGLLTTSEPSALDPAELLAGLEQDPELLGEADRLIALLRSKLHGGLVDPIAGEVDALLAEAKAMALGRITGGAA